MTKRCSKCQQRQPVSEFYVSRRASDGLQSSCKTCQRSAQRTPRPSRQRKYYAANRERAIASAARYNREHPDVYGDMPTVRAVVQRLAFEQWEPYEETPGVCSHVESWLADHFDTAGAAR